MRTATSTVQRTPPSSPCIVTQGYFCRRPHRSGPGQLATLKLVRAIVEAGVARAVMGNHELNAIAWALGHRLRSEKNRKQHEAFFAEVGEGTKEHRKWVKWLLELPVWMQEAPAGAPSTSTI
jgi:hypothetical protein